MSGLRGCLWDSAKYINKLFSFLKCCNNLDENSFNLTRSEKSYIVNYMKRNYYILDNNDSSIDFKEIFKIKHYETNYIFTYMILVDNNISYNINLKTSEYTYCIDGNCLDNKFFKYYMKKYYFINIDSFDYIIEVMDQNLKKVYVKSNNIIYLHKDNYEVI